MASLLRCGRRRATAPRGLQLALALTAATASPAAAQPVDFIKEFTPEVIVQGGVSTLTFTITNHELAGKDDLAFTDLLPIAVDVASPNGAVDGCGGALSATPGSGSITYSGGSIPGPGGSCTISVDVTSATPGDHPNLTGDLTSSAGNHGSAGDTLTVTSPPALVITKMAALPDGNDPALPGDRIAYSVTVTNVGGAAATNVSFEDFLDANTSLTPGSLSVTPIARNDSFDALGNVALDVPLAGSVLGNDDDLDGGSLVGVTAVQGSPANLGVPTGTSQTGLFGVSGEVTMQADGSFTYEPPPGFRGTDTFTYTVVDDDGDSDTGTVEIETSRTIWFVDNSAAGPGDGRLNDPFDTLTRFASIQGTSPPAATPGDGIFLATGSTDYSDGIILQPEQILVGQGAEDTFEIAFGVTPPPFSAALPPTGGTPPVITNGSGDGIELASHNTIRGLNIGNTAGTGLSGTEVGTLKVREVSIGGSGGGVDLRSTGGGVLDVILDNLSASSSTDEGILLDNVSGAFAVTGTGNTISTIGPPAVDITGAFPLLSIDLSFESVSADGGTHGIDLDGATTGRFSITGSGPPGSGGLIQNTTGDAIDLSPGGSSDLTVEFTDLDVTGPVGAGLRIRLSNSADGEMAFDSLRITAGSSTGDAVDILTNDSSEMDFLLYNSELDGSAASGSGGIRLESANTSRAYLDVSNNSVIDSPSQALSQLAVDAASVDGRFVGNQLDGTGGTSGTGGGVHALQIGSGINRLLFDGNTITDPKNDGFLVETSGSGSGSMDVIVDGNTVGQASQDFAHALRFHNFGSNPLCLDLVDNSGTGSTFEDIGLNSFSFGIELDGFTGSTPTDAMAFIAGNNLGNTVGVFGLGPYSGATCDPPPATPPADCPDDVLISNYQTATPQFVEVANVGSSAIDLGPCSVVTFNVSTETSIGSASVGLSGTLPAGGTTQVALTGAPMGPGAIGLYDGPAPPDGTPFSTQDEITGMVYLDNDTVFGIGHLTQPSYNDIYDCIYGGSASGGPFQGPFVPLVDCLVGGLPVAPGDETAAAGSAAGSKALEAGIASASLAGRRIGPAVGDSKRLPAEASYPGRRIGRANGAAVGGTRAGGGSPVGLGRAGTGRLAAPVANGPAAAASPAGRTSSQHLDLDLGTLDPGQSVSIGYEATVADPLLAGITEVINGASIFADGGLTDTAQVTTSVQAPPCLAADGPSQALNGEVIPTFELFEVCVTITLENVQVVGPDGHLFLRVGDAVIFIDNVAIENELTVESDPSLR